MIRIGLTRQQKQKEINSYVDQCGIKKVFCFYSKRHPEKFNLGVDTEYREYDDIIEYEYFYRLLQDIDEDSLIVINECLRTRNRSDLTYNCAHHYCNQTPHKIVFEYFPIIEDKSDFMILLDFVNKGKFRGKGFDYGFLQTEDVKIRPRKIKLRILPVETTKQDRGRYEKKKEDLFESLGDKDPDTIPRNLTLLAGNIKKKDVRPDNIYVARNKRFKLSNVFTYQEVSRAGDYIIIDMHYRRLNFNDFLKRTNTKNVEYLCTTLPIDDYIASDFMRWKGRLDAIYAQANIY